MTNNSLIAGMDDVVAHIQKLEKENKELKEKHKKVDDDYQKVIDYMAEHKECDVYDGHSDWIIEEVKKLKSKVAELEKFKKEAEDTTESFPVMESMMDQLEQKDKQIEEKDKQIAIFTKDKESNIWGHGIFGGKVFIKFKFNIVNQWISSFIDCYSDGNYCDSDELNLEDEVQEALFEDVAKELNDIFNACLFDRFGNIESTSCSGEGELQQACWDRIENMIIDKYLDKMEVDTEVKREGIDKTVRISLEKYRDIFINGEEDPEYSQ